MGHAIGNGQSGVWTPALKKEPPFLTEPRAE